MKDGKAREDIYDIQVRLQFLEKVKPKISVKFCKKCKHDTAQAVERIYVDEEGAGFFWMGARPYDEYTRCLNCGTLWEEKTVCKEVK